MTWLDDLTLDTVIVHTTEGMSFKGLKASVHDDCIVLRETHLLQDDGPSEQINGLVPIPREKVHFLQVLDPGVA
jgi:hypothetical protein